MCKLCNWGLNLYFRSAITGKREESKGAGVSLSFRALTPLFWNGTGAHGIGKISCVLTKIGKFDIVLMYDDSIARLIPIIKTYLSVL